MNIFDILFALRINHIMTILEPPATTELGKSHTDHLKTIETLAQRYSALLKGTDLPALFSHEKLSGVFLACPNPAYFDSKRKIMLIGQETRGWLGNVCKIKNELNCDIAAIKESMHVTSNFHSTKPKRSRFGQFKLKASKSLTDSSHAAIWANQFCIDYRKGSPIKSKAFPAIKELSEKLLQAQFEILKPDIAIFAVGSSRDKYIKEAFAVETVEVIVPRRLWHFKIGNTHCLRCNHPRWHGSSQYINQAIELAKTLT